MEEVDNEDRPTVRQRLASQTGFTGLSVLHQLYRLYQFDVLNDLIFDTMHTLVLRVLNCHLQYYTEQGLLKNAELGRKCLGQQVLCTNIRSY